MEQRIRLLKKQGHDRQLVITFTRKAANNLKERLGVLPDSIYVGTCHSFCFKMLQRFAPESIRPKFLTEGQNFKIEVIASQLIKEKRLRVDGKDAVQHIEWLFNHGFAPHEWPTVKEKKAMSRLCYDVHKKLKDEGFMFFAELQIGLLEEMRGNPETSRMISEDYPIIMVDEFQDTDDTQAEILRLLTLAGSHLYAVGDSSQSIYTWRGCNPDILDKFEDIFGDSTRVVLDTNFRSSDEILEVSNEILQGMNSKVRMTGCKGSNGIFVTVGKYPSPVEEAEEIIKLIIEKNSPNSEAVLYRINSQSGLLQSGLAKEKIPFTVSGASQSFFDFQEIKPLVSYLKLSEDITDVDSLKYVWNRPSRFLKTDWLVSASAQVGSNNAMHILRQVSARKMGVGQRRNVKGLRLLLEQIRKEGLTPLSIVEHCGKSTGYVTHLEEMARKTNRHLDDLTNSVNQLKAIAAQFKTPKSLLEHIDYAVRLQKESEQLKRGVTLSTIHSAKGLEFPRVFVIGVEEGIFPHEKMYSEEEEHRLTYVALTRAEEELLVSYYDKPSRFIKSLITKQREAARKEAKSVCSN